MADRKITDLTALAAGSQATGDLLTIVDVSEAAATDKNKKITVESLFKGIPSNVGIGTSSPSGLLHISGNTCQMHFTDEDDSSSSRIYLSGSTFAIDADHGNSKAGTVLAFRTDDAERMRIDTSGKVGIGTTSPTRNLVVQSTGQSDILIKSGNANFGQLIFGDTDADFRGAIGYNHTGDNMAFTTAGSERMRIDSSGRLGLGTSNPGGYNGSADELVIANSDNCGLTIKSTSTSSSSIHFADAESTGSASYAGFIAYTHSSDYMFFGTGANERMRIDSSGRVGIGETSPGSYDSGARNLVVGSTSDAGILIKAGTSSYSNLYFGDGTGAASYRGTIAYNHSEDSLRFGAAGQERMRVDSSGNVGIGTSSPGGKLHIESAATTAGWQIRTDSVGLSNESGFYRDASDHYELVLRNGSGGLSFLKNDGGASTANLKFNVQGSERMRIGSTGTAQTYADGSTDNLILSNSTSAGTSVLLLGGRHSATSTTTGTVSFRVYTNGNVQNTNNSYGAISDAKLKENIVDASSQWDDIKGIRVRNYNFIEGQTHTQIGVVAQEVETVSPGLVFDTPDRDDEGVDLGTVTKSVNYSVLYMKAVKALQEAMNRIETLETSNADLLARVTALEAG